MEIIAEIILQIFGWLLQFLGELVMQVIIEVIAELIGHSIKTPFRRTKPINPWLAVTGYFLFGTVAGGISLWLFPENFIHAPWLRLTNLILTPLAAGIVMSALGAWRRRKEQQLIRLDTFAYGFCFALAMTLIRFFFGQ